MMMVAGRSRVKAVYNVEYHKVPAPIKKSGAQEPIPRIGLYGATRSKGGMHKSKETIQPTPKPSNTCN